MADFTYNELLANIWTSPYDFGGLWLISAASNIIVGNNPPYSVTDFFAQNPKFGGSTVNISGTIAGQTFTVANPSVLPNTIAIGQYLVSSNLPSGTTITAIAGNVLTLSANGLANISMSANVYVSPLVPTTILNGFIYLASNSIFKDRWQEGWMLAMSLFIAHYATLWMQAEVAGPNSTPAQAVTSGLAIGLDTAQAAGDVSYSVEPLLIDGAGAWNLTLYGQQLATMAMALGSGPMFLW